MDTGIRFEYNFHAAGQGTFASGCLTIPYQGSSFHWVYDCGSTAPKSVLLPKVEHFRESLAPSDLTCGFILALKVTPADVQDRDGARLLLPILTTAFGWLKRIWADGGYSGPLEGEVARLKRHRQIELEIVKRSDKGFKILPKRWIVERTFGWLIQSRRLIRDHEVRIEHSEALIYLSMTKRMLARIAA
jgi:transposase